MKLTRALVALSIVFASTALGGPRSELLDLETRLRERIASLVERVDPDALVIVTLQPDRSEKAELPMTPYYLDSMALTETDGEPRIARAVARILTKSGKLPETVREMVSDTLEAFSTERSVLVDRLPEAMAPPAPPKTRRPTPEDPAYWIAKLKRYRWEAIISFGFFFVLLVLVRVEQISKAFSRSLEFGFSKLADAFADPEDDDLEEPLVAGHAVTPPPPPRQLSRREEIDRLLASVDLDEDARVLGYYRAQHPELSHRLQKGRCDLRGAALSEIEGARGRVRRVPESNA